MLRSVINSDLPQLSPVDVVSPHGSWFLPCLAECARGGPPRPAVISKAPASTTDRAEFGERLIRADRTSSRLSSIPFRSSGSQDPGVGPTQISEGSTGIARFIRTQSKAALRTIVFIHPSSEPRPASNMAPFLHARSRATCATSSAEPESPTIRYAIHHSRRQKRCTNCPAHSSSPAQKPSRRSSSDTLSCVIGASPFSLLSSPLVRIACWGFVRIGSAGCSGVHQRRSAQAKICDEASKSSMQWGRTKQIGGQSGRSSPMVVPATVCHTDAGVGARSRLRSYSCDYCGRGD